MQYRKLGRTDLEVSTVCMGCWAIVGDSTWGAQEEGDAIAAIRAALDAGVNFFDTAEAYGGGYSEELLAKALRGRRDEAVLASKVSPNHLEAVTLRERCETSLRLLDTDRIDLYQIHWPSRQVPLTDALETLEALRQEGKIRAIGVCNVTLDELKENLARGPVVSDQFRYSMLYRDPEKDILPSCAQRADCINRATPSLAAAKPRDAARRQANRAERRVFRLFQLQTRHLKLHAAACGRRP